MTLPVFEIEKALLHAVRVAVMFELHFRPRVPPQLQTNDSHQVVFRVRLAHPDHLENPRRIAIRGSKSKTKFAL